MSRRYFLESESSKPGQISDELRAALGIEPDKLPIWVYRMRALGYPPGYLKQAQVSSLDIFDDPVDERDLEDGEIAEYDHSKLIVYPGFNAPMPEGVIDCHYYLGMPPMMEHQQLDYAKIHLKSPKPLQMRSRLTCSTPNSTAESTNNLMNDSTDNLTADSANNLTTDSINNLTTDSINSISAESSTSNVEVTPSGTLKMLTMSSPMPNNQQKPALENFSKGMSDLIYFENLPNTTGIYERVRKVLNKSRNKSQDNIE